MGVYKVAEWAYSPKGGKIIEFHNSRANIRAIAGSPGSAKSTACALEVGLFLPSRQEAYMNSKGVMVRTSRVGVIRSTYDRLRKTTHKTISDWLLPGSGSIPKSSPMEGKITYQHPSGDGSIVIVEYLFLSMDKAGDLDKLNSLELSYIYLNEANELSEDVFIKSVERMGRFPSPKDAHCTEPSLILDFNLPGKEHWLYRYLVKKDFTEIEGFTKEDVAFFQQPPAVICLNYEDAVRDNNVKPVFEVNPMAENLENLPKGYYHKQLALNNWKTTQSRLLMKWVNIHQGKMVYTDYRDNIHKSNVSLEVQAGEPLYIGADFSGIHPAIVCGQFFRGQLQITSELYGDNMGQESFINTMLKPLIATKYHSVSQILIICDPSNPRDARTATTPVDLLKGNGLMAISAPTNKFQLRTNAVSKFLTRQNGIIIDLACTLLVEGFEEQYCYKRLAGLSSEHGIDIFDTKPDKTLVHGHAHDALQYLCLHFTQENGYNMQQDDSLKGSIKQKRIM